MTRSRSLRMAAALVLLLATVVFVIGIRAEQSLAGEAAEFRTAENSAVTSDGRVEEPAEQASENRVEGEAAEESSGEAAGGGAAETAGEDEANEASETLLGISPESSGAVAAAVVVSVALAAALWLWGAPIVLIVSAGFALLFAAFDLREVAHQLSEAAGGLASIAVLATVLHVGVAVLAGLALARRDASVAAPAR